MSGATRGVLVPYLALVALGLGALNYWQANAPIDTSPVAVDSSGGPSPPKPVPAVEPPAELRSLNDLAETLARPLFRKDRRPPPSTPQKTTLPAPEPAAPLASADSLRLIGMMRSGTAAGRALIRVAGNPQALWVDTGGEVGGWKIGRIEADRVLIERNGDKAELKLFAPKAIESPKP